MRRSVLQESVEFENKKEAMTTMLEGEKIREDWTTETILKAIAKYLAELEDGSQLKENVSIEAFRMYEKTIGKELFFGQFTAPVRHGYLNRHDESDSIDTVQTSFYILDKDSVERFIRAGEASLETAIAKKESQLAYTQSTAIARAVSEFKEAYFHLGSKQYISEKDIETAMQEDAPELIKALEQAEEKTEKAIAKYNEIRKKNAVHDA